MDTQSFYTSVPFAQSKAPISPGTVSVTVKVANEVSESGATMTVSISEDLQSPCLHHALASQRGRWIDIFVLGLPPGPGNVTLQTQNGGTRRASSKVWSEPLDEFSDTPRWRHVCQSSGHHSITGLLLLDSSNILSKHALISVFEGVQPLLSVRIIAPRIIYLSRFPFSLTWHAEVEPRFQGCSFYWMLGSRTYVTAIPQLILEAYLSAGSHSLKLEAWNALGSTKSSMVFEVATTLLLLNCTLSSFFDHESGTISLIINQLNLPDAIFIDFGDDTLFNFRNPYSSPGALLHVPSSNDDSSSTLTLSHVYAHSGTYDVFVNVTNSAGSGFDRWVTVVVEERIVGAKLRLLSPPVVELLKEISVSCLVSRGTNLQFKWDFGDGSDGEQYTRMETHRMDRSGTNCTAHHIYGIANTYNISVSVFNNYEFIELHLDTNVQAVEPIVELHLHPRLRGRYAAPLYKNKMGTSEAINSSVYSTAPIEFESGVWRGSDVQFVFDFGDGIVKGVAALLNAWSLPYAIVKHAYIAEGSYNVSVSASNLLSSVNVTLEKPFYVQFLPENLLLDRQYYIIEHGANVTLRASVSQGTDVSYNWIVRDIHLTDTGNTLILPQLNPGIYVVVVEAYNQVTDYGYSTIRRPNATAKIYVQEKLLGVQICIIVNSSDVCNPGVLDLPLDEEVQFRAKVIPSTETVLRFIWQLDAHEIRRTNTPVFIHRYQQAGWYSINMTAQNHISSISSSPVHLNLVQKVANLTSIFSQGPNLVNHPVTYRALYWFGTNLTFHWDFGDDSNSVVTTSSSVQHTYKVVGEYWVTVTVWNKFSSANITTNMFFLHEMCRKPEITFLHPRNRIARNDDDVLLEADISVSCKTMNVEYLWAVKKTDDGTPIDFGSNAVFHQRQLLIPRHLLMPGNYNIYLRINMVGTIVYAESTSSLEVVPPEPFIYIDGGFVHWVGTNDIRKMVAKNSNQNMDTTTQPLRYVWSCVPQIQKHLPCFKNQDLFFQNYSSSIIIPTSEITPNVGAIIVNVTVPDNNLMSASRLLEVKPVPHMLYVHIECEKCHNHHVNQQDKIQMRAVCKNCGNMKLEYHWNVWIIEDGKFRLHFGNYGCVQADGSTFFIIAPNSTSSQNYLNDTHVDDEENFKVPVANVSNEHMLAEKPYESVGEDIPPFPSLPNFPEENTTSSEPRLSRSARNTLEEDLFESLDLSLYPEYPNEGDANYEDNSSYIDFPYPDFMPYPAPEGPDYLITEEGMPGESGSAAARHQSSQNLGILLSEDEDQILEGAGKPRMQDSGSTSVFVRKSNELGDPLRDRFSKKLVSHIVSRPRNMLTLLESTTTGINSEYFILKPGVLKVGRSYLVQTKITNSESQEGFAMEYFKVNMGPFNGRCTLMPVEGYGIHFDFRLHCLEWKSDHLPLYYELSYSRSAADKGHLIYFGLNGNVKFNLPSGYFSNSNDVYLNVVVRDNLGASTKVCSIPRKVKPEPTNISLEHIVYNETFHPRSTLKKLIGEKNNQAALHKLHVLASTLNNHEDISSAGDSEQSPFIIRSKIRQGFFEIINSLKIVSKVEAVQLISVLSEIISDVQTINNFELQKAYNVFKEINSRKVELFSFYASNQMHKEVIIFLSKVAFSAHSVKPLNEDLIKVSRTDVIAEMKDSLKTRLELEEPLKISVPHLSVAAFYLTRTRLSSKPFILLKKSAIHLMGNNNLDSYFRVDSSRKCSDHSCELDDKCLMFFAQEYNYVVSSPNQNMLDFIESEGSSIFMSLSSCNDSGDQELPHLNMSVYFVRPFQLLKNRTKLILKRNFMNVHAINITKKHMNQALLFHLKFETANLTEENTAVDIMFRHLTYPTLTRYDMKKSYAVGILNVNVFISPDLVKVPGLYYISVLSNNYLDTKTNKEVHWQYEASLWKDVCLGRVSEFWSVENCHVLETTNHNWTHCSCSSMEMTAFSVPLPWTLSRIPIRDLVEPFFNPLPILAYVIFLLIYFLLLYLNLQQDRLRNLMDSAIPLRDNDSKHKQFYLLCLKTGYYFSSGTTSSVFIVLHGTKDVTETRQLIGKDSTKFCFQKGSVDVFLLSTERNLGALLKIEIWHDNRGVSPSWYLKTVSVRDLNSGVNYSFLCYNWLSAEMSDGQIERELTVAENPPSFKKILFENVIMCMNDFNMWNAVVWKSPVSYFTGVQRITCCFCFILNCMSLLSLFKENYGLEVMEDDFLPLFTGQTVFAAIICTLISSVPQILHTWLFRFSKKSMVNVDPKLADFFHWLSPASFKCWLKPKRSTSSRSTDQSSSISGSDSVYSSFEDSSVLSVPNLLEESFSMEDEEKDGLTLSFSYPDISDPVSPLQKTLSTWQTLENWLKRKQDSIRKPDVMLLKRHSYVSRGSSGAVDPRFDRSSVEDNTSRIWRQSISLSENSNVESNAASLWCKDVQLVNKELDLIDLFPCLPSVFYSFSWFILIANFLGSSVFILITTTRYPISYSFVLFKNILISVTCSCIVITPLIILLFSVFYSFKHLFGNDHWKPLSDTESSTTQKRLEKENFIASSCSRIEYFKKYLRPPKEQVLEQFRLVAARQKRICTFYSDIWNFAIILILLVSATYPGDVQARYLQQSSVENSLFRTLSKTTKYISSKYPVLSWLESDFLDGFVAEHQCHDTDETCVLSTNSIIVGSIILRHFYSTSCSNPYCNLLANTSHQFYTFGDIYERRALKGYNNMYYTEDEWQVMTDQIFYSYDEMLSFVEKLNSSSAAASLELLLFNPTISMFTSVSLLFEMTSTGTVILSTYIMPVVISGSSNLFNYLKVFFNLIFFVFMLFQCKNHVWKITKEKSQYCKKMWNFFSCLFIIVYFIYVTFFVLYVITSEEVALKLQATQLSSNVNITKVAQLETVMNIFVGMLMFLHMLTLFKVISFSERLKNMWKRLKYSQRKIFAAILAFIVTILSSVFMIMCFIGSSTSFSHPLFGFVKVTAALFRGYARPEVAVSVNALSQALSIFVSAVLITVHLYLFSIIRSVLLNYKHADSCCSIKSISLKETTNLIRKKFLCYFTPDCPSTVSQIEYVPPTDFLLYELERLADTLLSKANSLFPEKNDIVNFLESDFVLEKSKLASGFDLSEVVDVCGDDNKNVDFDWQERLIATMPRQSKTKLDKFMPSSFHASLGSEKKCKLAETSTTLLQNRIRKTYPLSRVDSGSTASSSGSLSDEKLNSGSSLLVRKTKSRGKGKNEEFDLNFESSDNE